MILPLNKYYIYYIYTLTIKYIYLPAANFPFAKYLLVIYIISMGSSSTTMYIVSPGGGATSHIFS